jgi:hypothetical protein
VSEALEEAFKVNDSRQEEEDRMHAAAGDEILIDSTEVGQPPRRGKIVEVRGDDPDHEHYRVQWDDGHESVFFPSSTAHTIHRAVESS